MSYDEAAVLQREVADRLLDQLDFMLIEPKVILDCGARTGYLSKKLEKRYPNAQIIALDISTRLQESTLRSIRLCSGYESLPLQKQSVDMIVSNCALQWTSDVSRCFREFQRVLKPEGLILFSMFGRDTLKELRESSNVTGKRPINPFLDMHDVGDLLLQSGFQDPVMNMEMITMHYQSVQTLFKDLKITEEGHIQAHRLPGLMGKNRWKNMLSNYEKCRVDDAYPASFEIVYGHAWQADQPASSFQNDAGESLISIDSIQK